MLKLFVLSVSLALLMSTQTAFAEAAEKVVCQSARHKLEIAFNQFDENVAFDGTKFEFFDRHNPPNKPISFSMFNCGNNREMKYIDFGVSLENGKPQEARVKFSHYHSPRDVDVVEDTLSCRNPDRLNAY